MNAVRLLVLVIVGAVALGSFCDANAQSTSDVVSQELETAKANHDIAMNKAATSLAAAFDAQVRSLTSSGDADSAKLLSTQKAAFISAGTLPQSPLMKPAVVQYLESVKAADGSLVDAYNTAIEGFNKESSIDLASRARKERDDLAARMVGAGSGAGSSGTIATPVSITQDLEAAKTRHRQEIDDAEKTLLKTIGDRTNAATDAGDLMLVQTLQAAQATAAVDGTVPDDVKDPAVLAAKRNYEASLAAAKSKLKLAYQKAVRDYTRARQITLAQATQNELDSLGLVDPAAPTAMTAGTYQLTSKLPDFLTAKDSVFVSLTDRRGVIVPETHYIRTKENDLLSKNFTFDAWVYMIRGLPGYRRLPPALIGLGEGTANPVNGGPEDSLYLEINPPDQNGGEVSLHRRQASSKAIIGRLRDFDTYVVRIQKSGNSVTFSLGTEQSGTLVPEMSLTVGDVRSDSPYLNDQNGHLFFGSGAFKQLAIGPGPAPVKPIAAAPDSTPATASNAPAARSTAGSGSEASVYLSDLQEISVSTFQDGTWGFGKHGRMSSQQTRLIHVRGQATPHGLGLHPPSHGDSVVVYAIDKKFERFEGSVALDDESRGAATPVIFRVLGDGRELWRSAPISRPRMAQRFSIDVSGIDQLQIIDGCSGEHDGAQAVWIEPRLLAVAQQGGAQAIIGTEHPGRTVNLLSMVKVAGKDAVGGNWKIIGGKLIGNGDDMSRFEFPYQPPTEYDFRVEFVRDSGNDDIFQAVSANGHAFRWVMAAYDNHVAGFETINGKNCYDNATSLKRDTWFSNGQPHTSVVKVRKQLVQAYIDDELVDEWKTEDYREMQNPYPLKHNRCVGIGFFKSAVTFTKVEVVEITGKGLVVPE